MEAPARRWLADVCATWQEYLLLRAELEDRVAFGDRGRVDRRAEVLLDPLRCPPGRLVGPGLVFADRYGHAAVTASNSHVVDEAWDPADEGLHVLLALTEKIKEFRRALPRIASKDRVHADLPFAWLAPLR